MVYGLSSLGEGGQAEAVFPIWLPLLVGLVAMVIFIWRQIGLARQDKALLDLRTFLSRNYTVSVLTMAIAMMALFGMVNLLPIYTQNVLGLDTLQTGLLLPGGLLMGLLAPSVGRLYDRIGPTKLLVPGTVLVSIVLWALTRVDQHTSVWAIPAGHVVISVGLALVFTPLFTAALGSVKMEFYSHGSAILGSVQQVAGAAGIALFVALMTIRTAGLTDDGVEPISPLAGGIQLAFLVGAVISLFAIVTAFFVRKPEAAPA